MNFQKPTFTLIAILVLSASAVFAGDLTGTWETLESWGARAGKTDHNHGQSDDWRNSDAWINSGTSLTLKITEQSPDGRGFHGEWCSINKCEDLVGAAKSNGTLLMVDEDGYFEGTLVGDNLELCYMEADAKFRIVSCQIMKKKK